MIDNDVCMTVPLTVSSVIHLYQHKCFTSVLHAQSTKKKRKSPYKVRSDFKSDKDYGQYIKATIKKGMKVRARSGYESVNEGDYGVYQQMNDGTPPAQFTWEGLGGESYWVFWHMVEILPPLEKTDDSDRADKPGQRSCIDSYLCLNCYFHCFIKFARKRVKYALYSTFRCCD